MVIMILQMSILIYYLFSQGCKQDEAFIDWLSGALVDLEQHSNTHTKEAKATRYPSSIYS
jgi:hypothetical protein